MWRKTLYLASYNTNIVCDLWGISEHNKIFLGSAESIVYKFQIIQQAGAEVFWLEKKTSLLFTSNRPSSKVSLCMGTATNSSAPNFIWTAQWLKMWWAFNEGVKTNLSNKRLESCFFLVFFLKPETAMTRIILHSDKLSLWQIVL